MTSYTKWDRGSIERVGGPEEAERRRKTLMARQSGQRLAEERKQRGLTQAQLAETMGVTPGRVSQIERGEREPSRPSPATSRHSAGTSSPELVANFADHSLTVTTTEAAYSRICWRSAEGPLSAPPACRSHLRCRPALVVTFARGDRDRS